MDGSLTELFSTTIAAMQALEEAEQRVPTDQAYNGPAFSDRAEQVYNRLCFALRDTRAEARKLTRAITTAPAPSTDTKGE
jgi:hypothetical protein